MRFKKKYLENLDFLHDALVRSYAGMGKKRRIPAGFRKITELYVRRRGKLLRPFITLSILEAFGKNSRKYAGVLGAIELMEAATISFDDLIDESPLRRGGASTHEIFGEAGSYLAFQAAYNYSYRAFEDLKMEDWRKEDLLFQLSRDIFLYFFGQNSELLWSAEKKIPSPEAYLSMSWDRIRFLSFNGPFVAGAHLAGLPAGEIRNFRLAGSWLGMAYHLLGDELNIFPRSGGWGKQPADDVTSGRYTYLILKALEGSSRRDAAFITRTMGKKDISKKDIIYFGETVKKSGALEKNRRKIEDFIGKYRFYVSKCFKDRETILLFEDLGRYMAYEREK